MKSTFLIALALGALASSCASNHWNPTHVGQRVTYQFTGYRGPVDGNFFAFVGAELGTIGVTSVRHFLNYNPQNPFQYGTVDRESVPTPPPVDEFEVENEQSPRRVY
jgi:hypothetical protein